MSLHGVMGGHTVVQATRLVATCSGAMLAPDQYAEIRDLVRDRVDKPTLEAAVNRIRLERVKQFLAETDLKLDAIAIRCVTSAICQSSSGWAGRSEMPSHAASKAPIAHAVMGFPATISKEQPLLIYLLPAGG